MLSKPPRSDESKIKSSQSVSTAGNDPSVAAGSSNMRHPIGEQHDERHPSRPMPASCLPPAATKERAYHRCLGSVARTCTTAASCQPRGSAASYRRRAMRLNVSTPTTDRDEARRASTRQAQPRSAAVAAIPKIAAASGGPRVRTVWDRWRRDTGRGVRRGRWRLAWKRVGGRSMPGSFSQGGPYWTAARKVRRPAA